ncbi:MAG: hypothetical protein Q9214_007939, partial [Letrouitia sp. 1 TL-2023]
MSKLIPGRIQKKRKERKAAKQQRKEQEEADDLEVDHRGRSVMDQTATSADAKQRSRSTLGESSLMTNDSEIEIEKRLILRSIQATRLADDSAHVETRFKGATCNSLFTTPHIIIYYTFILFPGHPLNPRPDADATLSTNRPSSPPPLVSRQSHVGYLTSSSPLIKTTAIEDTPSTAPLDAPAFQTPQYHKSSTLPNPASTSTLPTNLALQHATTMDTRKASTVKEAENHPDSRAISPGARIKDVFKPGSRKKEDSPPVSPDRMSLVSNESSNTYGSLLK